MTEKRGLAEVPVPAGGEGEGTDPSQIADSAKEQQEATREAIESIEKSALVGGRLIRDVDLTGSPTKVEHKLGTDWGHYVVVKRDAAGTIIARDDEQTATSKYITLKTAGTNIKVDIVVFPRERTQDRVED